MKNLSNAPNFSKYLMFKNPINWHFLNFKLKTKIPIPKKSEKLSKFSDKFLKNLPLITQNFLQCVSLSFPIKVSTCQNTLRHSSFTFKGVTGVRFYFTLLLIETIGKSVFIL